MYRLPLQPKQLRPQQPNSRNKTTRVTATLAEAADLTTETETVREVEVVEAVTREEDEGETTATIPTEAEIAEKGTGAEAQTVVSTTGTIIPDETAVTAQRGGAAADAEVAGGTSKFQIRAPHTKNARTRPTRGRSRTIAIPMPVCNARIVSCFHARTTRTEILWNVHHASILNP